MKKVLITRKLLRLNEDRISKLWEAKLNLNDEVYSQTKLVELSQDCEGILCSVEDKIDETTINKISKSVKIISEIIKRVLIIASVFNIWPFTTTSSYGS